MPSYIQAHADSDDHANDCREWHCADTAAAEGWAPVSLHSPYTDRLDTRWTVITGDANSGGPGGPPGPLALAIP